MWESRWASLKLKLRECMNSWGGQTKQEVGDGHDSEDGEDAGPRAATKQVVELTGEQKEMGGYGAVPGEVGPQGGAVSSNAAHMTDPKSLLCCKQRATGDLAVGSRMAEARLWWFDTERVGWRCKYRI